MRFLMAALGSLIVACGAPGAAVPCIVPLPADSSAAGPCVTESLATNQTTYKPGEALAVTVTAVNTTPAPCAGARELACGGPALVIQDASDKVVFTHRPPAAVCSMMIRLLQPGESMQTRLTLDVPNLAPGGYSLAAAPGLPYQLGRHYFRVC